MKKFLKITLFFLAVTTSFLAGAATYRSKDKIYNIMKDLKYSAFPKIFKSGSKETNSFEDFFKCKIEQKTVLIFEPNNHHHECMPGYAKYFTDLGYKVDCLITNNNQDCMGLFESQDEFRIFNFNNLEQMQENRKKLKERFEKYDYVLVQTTDPNKKELYQNLGLLETKKSIFVAHDTEFVKNMGMQNFFDENRVLTLGNFESGIQVNPHYFGNLTQKEKNTKTRFFVTSTAGRKYDFLVQAAKSLKKENLDFEIIVVGRNKDFNLNSVPENLKSNFVFKQGISYLEMYKELQNSDYVIITLDPENENDNAFKSLRVTGSAQLVYGFLKPALIEKSFAKNYNMTMENSFIFEKNTFTNAMRQAIKLNDKEYKEKQKKLKNIANDLYNVSIENLKKVMKI